MTKFTTTKEGKNFVTGETYFVSRVTVYNKAALSSTHFARGNYKVTADLRFTRTVRKSKHFGTFYALKKKLQILT